MELEEWFQQLQAQGYTPSLRLMTGGVWWLEIKKWSDEKKYYETPVFTRSKSLKIATMKAQQQMAGTTKPRFIFKPVMEFLAGRRPVRGAEG